MSASGEHGLGPLLVVLQQVDRDAVVEVGTDDVCREHPIVEHDPVQEECRRVAELDERADPRPRRPVQDAQLRAACGVEGQVREKGADVGRPERAGVLQAMEVDEAADV